MAQGLHSPLRLRIREGPREPRFPHADEALGASVHALLVETLARGVPPPALLVFRGDRVQLVELRPILAARRDVHRAIASFCALPGVEAIALVGVLSPRRRPGAPGSFEPEPPRMAVSFVEWADGRWWFARRPVGGADDTITRAVDGDPRPGGLGGWFQRARFEGLEILLAPHGEGGW